MISDEQMDARLSEAGTRWRAANAGAYAGETAPTEPVPITEAARKPFRSRWTVVASAAAVVALLTGAGLWFANRPADKATTQISGDGTEALTGVQWTVYSVSADTLDPGFSPAVGSGGFLKIAPDGTVLANDGCNTISGTATVNGSTISFGQLATTSMACLDAQTVQTEVDAVLSGEVSWSITAGGPTGAELRLTKRGTAGLLLIASQPSRPVNDPSKMAGTWQLVETDHVTPSGGAGSASGSGASPGFDEILAITADGSFKVQHRCYANSGTATIGAGTAEFGKTHLDGAVPCPAIPDMRDEQNRDALVDGTLTGTTTWVIENGQLKVTKGADTLVYAPYAIDLPTSSGTP